MDDPAAPHSLKDELTTATGLPKDETKAVEIPKASSTPKIKLIVSPELSSDENEVPMPSVSSSSLKAELMFASALSKDEKDTHCIEEKALQNQSSGAQKPLELGDGAHTRRRSQTFPHAPKTEDSRAAARSDKKEPVPIAAQSLTKNESEVPIGTAQISTYLMEGNSTLAERVQKIQKAFSAATRDSHCFSCLCDKKSQAPDLTCMDCGLSFCFRCSSRHKFTPSYSEHILVPLVEERVSPLQPRGPFCPVHTDTEQGMFCRNCDTLICSVCLVDQHLDCMGKVAAQEYACEERVVIKRCRVKYAQVMRFFSEQRRDTEETIVALNLKKQNIQTQIRKFFSALMKACMDVEGALLEELETCVSDHTDHLTEQSSSWQSLQESTQQLLDVTDILHFLPNADFLPLMEASKTSLSHALRSGESLAASAPPEMTLNLSLEQSSQRSVIKRIKEIGAVALTINTHKTLTLRKVSTMTFSTVDDRSEPLVTAMLLLTPCLLVAADFNNSCLKMFHKEEKGEGWNFAEELALKWRPYGISKLSEEQVILPATDNSQEDVTDEQEDPSVSKLSPSECTAGVETSSKETDNGTARKPAGKGSSTINATHIEIHLAVSSPFAGCFDIVVPVGRQRKMRVVRAIDEEKGYWGLAAVTESMLAVSTVASARSYVSLMDTTNRSTHRLPLTSDTCLTPLVSPRHILATSPTSILIGDHGKKAVIHATMDGKILFNFTGNSNERLSRPEGLCMDYQGLIYFADSNDHSISVLTKGGHLYSRTSSQQSDLHCPQALCVDKNSCVYVANEGGKLLTVYDIFQES